MPAGGKGTMAQAECAEMLRRAGMRRTRQRLALARLIAEGGDRHLSAEALHREAQRAGCAVSVATVYNTLHRFVDAGLLREIAVAPGCVRFDTNTEHHHHFYDEETGALSDIPGDAVRLEELPAPPAGRRVGRVEVVVRLVGRDGRAPSEL